MSDKSATRKEYIASGAASAISHYCDAVSFGDIPSISGIEPLDAGQNVIGGTDVVAQSENVFATMDKILEAGAATFKETLLR